MKSVEPVPWEGVENGPILCLSDLIGSTVSEASTLSGQGTEALVDFPNENWPDSDLVLCVYYLTNVDDYRVLVDVSETVFKMKHNSAYW